MIIYNLTDILRNQMKQTNNKNKNKEDETEIVRKIPSSFIQNNNKPIFPYNLKIDVELANRKSMDLYTKYYNFNTNTNTNYKPISIPRFSILDNKESNKVANEESDEESDEELNKVSDNKEVIEINYAKSGFTICSICVFTFLAYSYFKKG